MRGINLSSDTDLDVCQCVCDHDLYGAHTLRLLNVSVYVEVCRIQAPT